MARIVIIGSGFGGLTAARALRKRDRDVEITVVSPEPKFVYLPSLIWIPSGLRAPEDLLVDLDVFFARHRIAHHPGRVTGLADGGRKVITDAGEVANDGLIIASGGRFIKALPGIEHAVTLCEGVDAAVAIRDKLKAMSGGTLAFGFSANPKEPSAMRGGPMFELLFCVDSQLRREGRRDAFELVFFCPSPRPGQRLGEKAVDGLLGKMAKLGIKTHLGHKLTRFEADKIVTEGGEVGADLIMFMPGMTGPDWLAQSGLEITEGGLIAADELARARGAERVYVAGDAGAFPGPDWQAKQAHAADLQAKAAAANLLDELAGRTPTERFKHEIVCIVDTLGAGVLVFRDEKRSVVLPPLAPAHWAKRAFESHYLREFRR